MKAFRNDSTGEVFTMEEMVELWEQFGSEMKFDNFDEFLSAHEEVEQEEDKMRIIGKIFEDPEGIWKITEICGSEVTVKQIQKENINYGHEAVISMTEVMRHFDFFIEYDEDDDDDDDDDKRWFAVQRDRSDDWSKGSYDWEAAKQMLADQGRGLIAVINEETNYCEEEFDFYEIYPNEPVYIVYDEVDGSVWNSEFYTEEEALKAAQSDWDHLTDREKERRESFCVIKSNHPDPEDLNHFDGDVIKDFLNPDLELRNSFDSDVAFNRVEDVKRYYHQYENSESYGQEEEEFNQELDSCTDLYECADVLNRYSDTIGNGSRFEVVEI